MCICDATRSEAELRQNRARQAPDAERLAGALHVRHVVRQRQRQLNFAASGTEGKGVRRIGGVGGGCVTSAILHADGKRRQWGEQALCSGGGERQQGQRMMVEPHLTQAMRVLQEESNSARAKTRTFAKKVTRTALGGSGCNAGAPCSKRPSNDMCFSGAGELSHARSMPVRCTLAYCVAVAQSRTMVGEPSRVRYVTVEIC